MGVHIMGVHNGIDGDRRICTGVPPGAPSTRRPVRLLTAAHNDGFAGPGRSPGALLPGDAGPVPLAAE